MSKAINTFWKAFSSWSTSDGQIKTHNIETTDLKVIAKRVYYSVSTNIAKRAIVVAYWKCSYIARESKIS